MPPDSSVRLPAELLERAALLNPDNRSDAVRAALERGLQAMEDEQALQQRDSVEDLVEGAVARAMAQKRLGMLSASSLNLLPSPRPALIPLYGPDSATEPLIALNGEEEVELRAPQISWMIYEPLDVRVWVMDPGADVEISQLRSDKGNGPNLLGSGWYPAQAPGGGRLVVRSEAIRSPAWTTLRIRSARPTQVAVSLEARILHDGIVTVPQLPGPYAQARAQAHTYATQSPGPRRTAPPPLSEHDRLVQRLSQPTEQAPRQDRLMILPFSRVRPFDDVPGCAFTMQAQGLNFNTWIRVVGVVFSGDRQQLLQTRLQDFQIGGGSNLLCHEDAGCAADYTANNWPALRFYPLLRPPNSAEIVLRGPEQGGTAQPWLLVEEVSDLASAILAEPHKGQRIGPGVHPGGSFVD